MLIDALEKEIERTNNNEQYAIRQASEARQKLADMKEICTRLSTIQTSLIESVSVYSWGISIFTTPKAFLADECPEFIDYLEAIQDITGIEPESEDYPDEDYRKYKFGKINVFATPPEDGLCKRVIVGSRPRLKSVDVEVEEPVYAYKC